MASIASQRSSRMRRSASPSRWRVDFSGPGQHVGDRHRFGVGHGLAQVRGQRGELGQRVVVHARRGGLRLTLDPQPAVDLAARNRGADGFAQHRLETSQFVGHAQRQIEKAAVHRAQFDAQQSERRRPGRGSKAGHAGNWADARALFGGLHDDWDGSDATLVG
jgi:hypothetical protein